VLAVALAVAAVVLVAFVVTGRHVPLATEGSGGWHLTPRDARERPIESDSTLQPPVEPTEPSRLPGEGVLTVLVQALMILGGVTAMFLIGQALLRLSRRVPEPFELAPPEHWPEPAVEMTEAVDEGLAALSSGPVDEVIVACWVRLEDAASSAGAGRRAAETPAELASRVLRDLHAPPDAVNALLERYRRARFSHHRLGESDRVVAARALEEIRAAIAGVRS
jgi:hypothetical protein